MAIEDIKDLAERVPSLLPMLDDEAKTKQFLILPLIRALGYDDANPAEVVPEYTADFGTRTGWKADYALMSGERPLIVMECKQLSNRLSTEEINQLGRYFSFVPFAGAKIGVLTNGVIYKFFTDEAEPNKMDEVFSVNYFCRFRQLFLPVHPLFPTTLLGHSGAVAGDVEFQDDRVVDHPVDGRRRGHWVGEDVLPLGEDQVGRDAQGPAFVAFGDECEEHLGLFGPLGQVPQVVQQQEVVVVELS